MFRVVWPRHVIEQIQYIGDYIRQSNPMAAAVIADRLFKAGESLADFPNRGRPAGEGTRELVNVPPYVIRYRVESDRVIIRSIRHGAQRPLE